MNCRTCGTQLPAGEANCPQCGAATAYYYSPTEAASDDPTVVSSPETDGQPPPPPIGYGSPAYYNPYQSYDAAPLAPPPPSPQRPRSRIGIILGAVLLILLLIGGGVVAWLQYSSAQNAAAAAARAAATAHSNATASAVVQHFTATGTFTIVSRTTTNVRQDGQNKISSSTVQGVDSGDIMGSYTSEETAIAHPDNTVNFSGKTTCTCTVSGKSGTLKWSYTGTQKADGSFQGQFFDLQGTGDLAKLHGQGVFQGQGSDGIYSSELYFASQARS